MIDQGTEEGRRSTEYLAMAERIRSGKDLRVYNLGYEVAVDVFEISKQFPKEEVYSLMDQIRRSSRPAPSISAKVLPKEDMNNLLSGISMMPWALGPGKETRAQMA